MIGSAWALCKFDDVNVCISSDYTTNTKEVEEDFLVESCSRPNTDIMWQCWLHFKPNDHDIVDDGSKTEQI